MLQRWFHWTTALTLVAIAIIIATVFYSNYLSKKLEKEEHQKIQLWVEAQRSMMTGSGNMNLATLISSSNDDIPIIETDENDNLTGNYLNIDEEKIKEDSNYLRRRLREFKSQHAPIVLIINPKPFVANKYYYGESQLQKEVRYYPLVQILIFVLFVLIAILAQRANYKSVQNKMWVGMAKETAHQLGTPVSSLNGWIEVLRDQQGNDRIVSEMEKDVNRLQLISDRFGKIGAHPQLENRNLTEQVSSMVDYIKKRAGKKIQFVFENKAGHDVQAKLSPPLFDWVIENLLKNALDAIDEKGTVRITLNENAEHAVIDIEDSGKGISANNIRKIFNPGFTTKKRGWGLGLTLTKRIIEEYHNGSIFVKWSQIGKGTSFRILLKKG
jgi:signal transduction histidine kinase